MFTRIRSFSNRGLPTSSSPRKGQPPTAVDFSFRLDTPLAPPSRDSLEKEELRSASFDPDPIELRDDHTLRSYLGPLSKSPLSPNISSTQHDQIGTKHKSLEDSPIGEIDFLTTSRALGDVKGLKVLDLACGIGRWSRWCVEHGAEKVVGIDISEAMISGARGMVGELDQDLQKRLDFRVGDCSLPLGLEDEGAFDLVLGSWYLSYAPDHQTLVAMFCNIFNNLKPGGRFIGVVPNSFCPMYEPYEYYGVRMEPLADVGPGIWKCKFQYKPDHIVFETYNRQHGLYEKAAKEAGMGNVRWVPYILPKGDDREESGYWDEWKLRPHSIVLECVKGA